MAVATLQKSQMRLYFENGVHPETNEVIYKGKLFNNVKLNANADQLLNVAYALEGLQQLTLHDVERNDSSIITPA